jgi:endonuclease G
MNCKWTIFAVVGLAALAAGLASCEKPEPYDALTGVVLRQADLDQAGGSTFVSVTCKGAWNLVVECSDGGSWATVSPSSGSGNKGDVQLSYQANEGTESRSVTLILKPANGKEAQVTAYQDGLNSLSGLYGYDVVSMSWLELPATVAGDGREVLVHNSSGKKYRNAKIDGVRNWSCYWDINEHLSLWVAYPLNKNIRGSGTGRTEAWHYDDLLPDKVQPNLMNNSYGGGWTRGHQIPSADRQRSWDENASTYVPTNLTPQEYNFNGKIWANLESKVRGYADKADTLYVVTGCLFDKSTLTSGNYSGFLVKIPTHYFKALLFKGVSTYAKDGYMAAGFLLPHDSAIAGKDFMDYICSIDELEKETGIDFFPNLQRKVGKETAEMIEAETPSKWWN